MLMNGSGMGSLDVYILPEDNADFESRTPLVTFKGNQVLTVTHLYSEESKSNFRKFTGIWLAFVVN